MEPDPASTGVGTHTSGSSLRLPANRASPNWASAAARRPGTEAPMATDPARLSLYNRLGEVLGFEHADTLMESLPVQPAQQLATRSDIDRLEDRIDRLEDRIDRLEDRIARLEERIDGRINALIDSLQNHQRTYMLTVVSAMTGLTAIYSVFLALIN